MEIWCRGTSFIILFYWFFSQSRCFCELEVKNRPPFLKIHSVWAPCCPCHLILGCIWFEFWFREKRKRYFSVSTKSILRVFYFVFLPKKNVLCVSSNAHPRRNVFSVRPNKCRVTSGPWLLSSTHLEQSTCRSLFLYFVCRVFLCWMWIICGNVCVFSAEWNYTITCRWLDAVLRFAQIANIWVYVRIIGGLKPKDINDILWTLQLNNHSSREKRWQWQNEQNTSSPLL